MLLLLVNSITINFLKFLSYSSFYDRNGSAPVTGESFGVAGECL